jgi:glutamyl-tRNA synthetase
MTDNERLADLLFGSNGLTPEDCELRFPPRELPEGARVTRFSPSPTGYLHIGGLFGTLVDFLTARVSGGLTYLRIEDTDKKREVADGVSAIINGFKNFGLEFDEGVTGFDTEKGAYGPYTQSKRVEIYHAVAKRLVQEGKAYPCFCTADELAAIREEQENGGAAITGYFGKWAKCRDLSFDEQKRRIEAGEPYVLRFRSEGDENKRIVFDDMIRGKIEMPENIIDEVLLKSDGVPTYHFAHVCDDHFMRTTHVIRVDIFDILFRGIRVVKTEIAHSAVLFRDAEVDAYRLCVTDVQIAVGLRRESRLHAGVDPVCKILVYKISDKI